MGSGSKNDVHGLVITQRETVKLPMAGYRDYENGSLDDLGTFGDYRSSSVGAQGDRSCSLYVTSNNANMYQLSSRGYGSSVRCIKD
jgi:hypothetical protein